MWQNIKLKFRVRRVKFHFSPGSPALREPLSVLAKFSKKFKNAEIRVKCHFTCPVPTPLRLDFDQIEQNLLKNVISPALRTQSIFWQNLLTTKTLKTL